jgi:Rps23 Pro-64 3,4-dihydroxylase Tpa1-like proline 4-hydroxylase
VTTHSLFRVNVDRLETELPELKASYEAATPFRHVIIDNFLEPGFARQLHQDYPQLDAMQRSMARILKARSYDGDFDRFGSPFSDYFGSIQAEPFLSWLRRLTGIDDLEMDPKLVGGGLHQGARGSSLHVHADHNTHPHDPSRYRRINVLFYVNDGWKPSWGGELDLYDATGTRVVERVIPAFNRCVIMDVHDHAFHGYEALRIPGKITRKLLASYFYSDSPSELQTVESHPTLYGTPEVSKLEKFGMRVRRKVLHRLRDLGGLRPKPRR